MKELKVLIGKKKHRVIYIDYNGGLPHSVVTECLIETANPPYHRVYHWDFFANNGNCKDMRHYNSGSGGNKDEIMAPKWVKGHGAEYWMAEDIKLVGRVKNGILIKKPKRIRIYGKSSINPFKISEEAQSEEYCEECGYSSTEFCDEHKYIDEQGNDQYKSCI